MTACKEMPSHPAASMSTYQSVAVRAESWKPRRGRLLAGRTYAMTYFGKIATLLLVGGLLAPGAVKASTSPLDSGPWNEFQLSGPGSAAPTGRIAAVSRNPSTMEVFWIGPDGSVQDSYYYDGSGWNGFTLSGAGSASKTGGIAAVSRSPNTMEVFWIGRDGSVQDRYYYDGSGWNGFTLSGVGSASKTGGIAAVSRSSNTMEVFWAGRDGSVQDRYYYDGSGWNGFTLSGAGSASTTGGIAAVSRSWNTMEVFWTGHDGSVQDRYYNDGSGWNGFTLSGAGSASTRGGMAALSRDPRCLGVWWIAKDGHVEDANWNTGGGCEANSVPNAWSQWELAPAGSAYPKSSIVTVSRSSGTIELFWIAPDGHVQDASWYPNGDWSQSTLPFAPQGSGARASGLAAVSRNAATMELWWPGRDSSVHDNYWYAPPTPRYPHLTGSPTNYHWLVLKCTLSDNRDVPEHLDSLITDFLTPQGAGPGNITDYYSDVSYGAASLTADVHGWYAAPFNGNEPGFSGANNRYKRVQACADAIPAAEAANIAFGSYWGVIMVTNHIQDGGACFTGKSTLQIKGASYPLACVVFDPASMFTAFAAHEVGHGLGMPHSWDNTCEYCDPWDIMSALRTYQFDSAAYSSAGPGVNVPNLLHLGWIPNTRIATYNIGDPDTNFTLDALSHPLPPWTVVSPLTVKVPDFPFLFTVEYRQQDGWDAGIPNDAVIVHVYTAGADPYSFLFDTSTFNGSITAGQTLTLGNFRIQVNSTGGNGGTANITIGPAS